MEPLSILLVDDDAEIGKLMKLKLSKEAPGLSFHFVEGGKECLEYIGSNRVDCILSDYQMPGMNGMELLFAIRDKGDDVPFIFLTGQGNEEVASKAFKGGAYDYFTKDIGFAHFTRIINSVKQAVAQRTAETERRRAEIERNAAISRFETLLDSMDSLVYVADMESYEILSVNAYGRSVWGDLEGKVCWQVLQAGQDGPCQFCTNDRLLDAAGSPTGVYVWEFQNTVNKEWYECRDQAIRWVDGRLVRLEIATNITKRKHVEEALKQSEQRLQLHVQRTPLAVIEWDPDFCVTSWNPSAEKIFGYSAAEALGRHAGFIVPDSAKPHVNHVWSELLVRTGGERSTNENITKDGRTILCEWYNTPLIDDHGRVLGVASLVQDITEPRWANEALQASQKYLQTIIDTEPECVKLITADGTLLMMNRAGLDMIDADSLEQVKGKSVFGLIVPEYREAFKALGEKVYQGGTGTLEFDMVGLKGRRLRLETRAVPLRNEKDEIIALLGITRDITERARTEEQLAEQRELLRKTLESITQPYYVIDADNYKVIMANSAARLNISPTHNTCYALIHKRDKPCSTDGYICPLEIVKQTKIAATVEHSHLDNNGNERDVEVHGYPIFDYTGEVSQMILHALDITGSKQAMEALNESEEMFRTLFESTDDSIFLMEGDTLVDCNSRTVKMFGCTDKGELTGHTTMEYSPETQPDGERSEAKARSTIEAAYGGAPQRFYWEYRRKDGTPFDAVTTLNKITLKEKAHLLAIVRDMTAHKAL